MVRPSRSFRRIIAICAAAAMAAASSTPIAAAQPQMETTTTTTTPARNTNLEITTLKSDEYAESVITIKPTSKLMGIGAVDHEKITRILSKTRDMIDNAYELIQSERTLKEGQDMMGRANALFGEVKDIIRSRVVPVGSIGSAAAAANGSAVVGSSGSGGGVEERDLLRKKYADHDLDRVQEDEERALDIARKIYETMVTFPECVEQLLEVCLDIINDEIGNLGLSTIEVVVHEKRNQDQGGYNKVVIITNELADRVRGKEGDGIVIYPFLWSDSVTGQRTLGVDGKWNCHDYTPEDCCHMIKTSVPNMDTKQNNIECHIFVPFGGVGNPRRNDRVFITLSPDGRVHEAPIIQ